jgi:hypothetical protein
MGWIVITVPVYGQSFGLRGKMARHADVEPVMDSGSQIDDFDNHGVVLCNSQGSRAISQRTQATPFRNGAIEITAAETRPLG